MKIRKARKKDIKYCVELSRINELQLDTRKYPDQKYFKEFLGPLFIVAEEKENIIGYVLGEKEKAGLSSLNLMTVHKTYRGKGIGKLLLDKFCENSKRLGLKEVYLFAPKWNKKTLNFYEKKGFYKMKNYVYFIKDLDP
ncbi:MAG: GNAT family N-acetyltransferase [Nanoarchaeota archaeon]